MYRLGRIGALSDDWKNLNLHPVNKISKWKAARMSSGILIGKEYPEDEIEAWNQPVTYSLEDKRKQLDHIKISLDRAVEAIAYTLSDESEEKISQLLGYLNEWTQAFEMQLHELDASPEEIQNEVQILISAFASVLQDLEVGASLMFQEKIQNFSWPQAINDYLEGFISTEEFGIPVF